MDFIRRKYPYLEPNIISKYYQECGGNAEEAALLLGMVYDKSKISYIQYDTEPTEKTTLETFLKKMRKDFPILSDESIRIIYEGSNFDFHLTKKNAKKIIKAYEKLKSEENPKIKKLFERIQVITEDFKIDEFTFLLKINASKIRTALISFKHYKRLIQLIEIFLKDNSEYSPDNCEYSPDSYKYSPINYKYSPEVQLSDDEWKAWGGGNDNDDDDDNESYSLLDPFARLQYFFSIFDEDQIRRVYFDEAKKNYGVAYRILRERQVFFSISMEFISATDEEIRDAMEKAKGDERKVAQIIQNNKIENPVIEESIIALRPELTMQQATDITLKAQNQKDINELLDLSYQLYPQKPSNPIQSHPNQITIPTKNIAVINKQLNSKDLIIDIQIPDKKEKNEKESSSDSDEPKQGRVIEFPSQSSTRRRNISIRSFGPTLTLDLHGKRKPECKWFVESVLDANKVSKFSKINFITGKGKHSMNKVPVLRPLVMEICESRGLKAYPLDDNNGVVQVELA